MTTALRSAAVLVAVISDTHLPRAAGLILHAGDLVELG